MADALADFTAAEVERARRYHRPLYALLPVDLGLSLAVPAVLAFAPPGARLERALEGVPWWAATLALAAVTIVASTLVRLPLAFWRGYVHERRYGFSTQALRGWAWDRARGLALGTAIGSAVVTGLVGLARALPGAWPAVAAPALALLIMLLTFVGPVLLEPVFNRFRPLADRELAADLGELAIRAGVPVREVLVADASRRTRKENAYVSGIGATRRVVLYDTLLERAPPAELRLVTAHELWHRRARHVAKGTVLAAAGAAAGVVVLWELLGWPALLGAIGAEAAGDFRVVPFVLLAGGALELAALPLTCALSRRWERAADRGSLELTGDVAAFRAAHRALARANLADLDPPRALYLALFTHPTPPERLEAARTWAGVLPAAAR